MPASTPSSRPTAVPERDRFAARARPAVLYALVAVLLWALPVGLVAVLRPDLAARMAAATGGYFAALPDPFYALFGTCYLGYTAARQWGKARGTDR